MVNSPLLRSADIHIGTSGWHYAHWRGVFYPERTAAASMLAFYAGRFDCVELNNSFYRLPSATAFRAWRDTVPEGFQFAVKGSRYITHVRKLREPAEPIARLTGVARELGDKRGPVLFQLPPRWRRNAGRLREFLEVLPRDWQSAWEFRDDSWLCEEIYDVLREYGAALCVSDMRGAVTPAIVTAGHAYVRLHGSSGAYSGRYSDQALGQWARQLVSWAAAGHAVWCFFNNDQHGHAVADAERLRAFVSEASRHMEP
jgi:uncharacterized protein YecE (DUF72 family)